MYQALIPKSIGPDRNFVLYNGEILREGRHPNTDTSTVTQPHPYYNNDVNVMRATMGDVRILSGSAAANSDIDLLVEYTDSDSISLLTISRIATALRRMTGRTVDLVERSRLLPFASKSAEQDKILIYERKS